MCPGARRVDGGGEPVHLPDRIVQAQERGYRERGDQAFIGPVTVIPVEDGTAFIVCVEGGNVEFPEQVVHARLRGSYPLRTQVYILAIIKIMGMYPASNAIPGFEH
jgi:hypothetical protein